MYTWLRNTLWAGLLAVPLWLLSAGTADASYYYSRPYYYSYGPSYYSYSSPYYYSNPYYYSSPYYGYSYRPYGYYGGYYPYRSYRYGNYYGNRWFGYHDTPGRGGHFHIGPFRIR